MQAAMACVQGGLLVRAVLLALCLATGGCVALRQQAGQQAVACPSAAGVAPVQCPSGMYVAPMYQRLGTVALHLYVIYMYHGNYAAFIVQPNTVR